MIHAISFCDTSACYLYWIRIKIPNLHWNTKEIHFDNIWHEYTQTIQIYTTHKGTFIILVKVILMSWCIDFMMSCSDMQSGSLFDITIYHDRLHDWCLMMSCMVRHCVCTSQYMDSQDAAAHDVTRDNMSYLYSCLLVWGGIEYSAIKFVWESCRHQSIPFKMWLDSIICNTGVSSYQNDIC